MEVDEPPSRHPRVPRVGGTPSAPGGSCPLRRRCAFTGWGRAEDDRRARAAGFDEFVVKPADPDRLQVILAAVWNRHDREPSGG
jgi:hypothetical protein